MSSDARSPCAAGLRKRLNVGTAAAAALPNAATLPAGQFTYGSYCAISMALGFLFLGAGAQTFATTNTAVAALLIALFPRFPRNTTDHRCHLQARLLAQQAIRAIEWQHADVIHAAMLGSLTSWFAF